MQVLDKLIALRGRNRNLLTAFLGVLAALALPPFYLFPLLVPSFSLLYISVVTAPSAKQAFRDGWFWGLGYFVVGLYWICLSLFVDAEQFAWLTPFALFGLPSVLAIYSGCATWLLYFTTTFTPLRRVLFFAILFVGCEYLRACLFTGFPWNLIGYVWTMSDITIQSGFFGVYGLSFFTVLLATMPVLFVITPHRAVLANSVAVAILIILIVFGVERLQNHPTRLTNIPIRIVQANIEQTLKWDPKTKFAGLKKHMQLTKQQGSTKPRLIIWPEAAVPYYIEKDSDLVDSLGSALPKDSILLTGGLRTNEDEMEHHPEIAERKVWNSLFAINDKGQIQAYYDKHHLVPFGEYIPLSRLLPLDAIAGHHGDFSEGGGTATLFLNNIPPLSPLICYEAIFPGEAREYENYPKWLLNITNDAWFGTSTGPYQHLAMARMRAVEQQMPLIRAANTGISAIIDPYGRILSSLPLNTEGVLNGYLPESIDYDSILSRLSVKNILFIVSISSVFMLISRKIKNNFGNYI